MKRFLKSEAGAAVLWVLLALLMAAVVAPWVYQAGKNFGEYAARKELPFLLESLGGSCRRAKFDRFFSRSLSGSAILLLPLLFSRIRAIRAATGVPVEARVRMPWQSAAFQIAVGCVIAGGLLLGLGVLLEALGAYGPEPRPTTLPHLLKRILIPAVAASLLEEWIFRGLLLGLWLRFAKPFAACVGTSFFFAFLHFLSPPAGTSIANPASPTAGFELLEKILLHFTNPLFFVTDFATLFCIGMILAWARLRTGALWFSIGLHAGWIATFKGFSILHCPVPDHPLRPWGVGDTLCSGGLPLLALGLTAVICHFAMEHFQPYRTVSLASR